MNAAKALRRARGRAGLSQRELAERTGVAQPTIARIERGQVDPRVATLDRLLHACGERLEAAPRLSDGVDRTLIRELLGRSPRERVQLAAADARGLAELQRAFRAGRARR